MKNILFVCTGNLDRSPTAERIFKDWEDLEVKSAGTHWQSPNVLTWELIEWADKIFVMEEDHKRYIDRWIQEYNPEFLNKVLVLGIENNYIKGNSDLVKLLKEKVTHFLLQLLKN